MPRIPPALIRQARKVNPLLPPLLPVCRDLRSAQNELRWLGEHAAKLADKQRGLQSEHYVTELCVSLLQQYVSRRAAGEPLQYILGTEYFGDLEIKCRPGVLIPRQETAAAVSHLVGSLSSSWVAAAESAKLKAEERKAEEQKIEEWEAKDGTAERRKLDEREAEKREDEEMDAERRQAEAQEAEMPGAERLAAKNRREKEERKAETRRQQERNAVLRAAEEEKKTESVIPGVPCSLNVLDLCTGTGCIPLLFTHDLFSHPNLPAFGFELFGADISPKALELAKENLEAQSKSEWATAGSNLESRGVLRNMHFVQADVLKESFATALHKYFDTSESDFRLQCDILISNPPYISSEGYKKTTSSSVRRYEPRLALVPPGKASKHDGDLFYPRLLEEAKQLQSKIFLFEVADMEQAKHVAHLALRQGIWEYVEIWRDDPAASPDKKETVNLRGWDVKVFGEGHGRSVVAYRGEGIEWLGKRRGRGRHRY